jgi:hypothetical protein
MMIRLRRLLRGSYEGRESYDGQVVDFGFLMEEGNHLPPSVVFVLLVKIAISSLHSASASIVKFHCKIPAL